MPEDNVTLLQHVLLNWTLFSVEELGLALTEFKLIPNDTKLEELSKHARFQLLVEGAGFDDPQSVLAAYAAPAPPPPPERNDPELDGLLEELAEDFADNAADLKAYRGQLKQKAARRLGQARMSARSAKQKRLKAFRQKRDAKKKGKVKLKLKPVRMLKKRPLPRPGPDAAPPPAGTEPPPPAAPPPAGTEPPSDSPATGPVARPIASIRPPRAENGWQVAELQPHGWVRFHPERGNIDGHCRYHSSCKLDRRGHLAPLGLVNAWLARGSQCKTKEEHFQERIVLSLELTFEERQAARDTISASDDLQVQALVETEKAHRGGDNSEPDSIFLSVSQHAKCEAMAVEMDRQALADAVRYPPTP